MNLREVAPFEHPIKETHILFVGEQAKNFEMNPSNITKSSEVCASPIEPIGSNGTTGPSEQIEILKPNLEDQNTKRKFLLV